MCCSLMTWSLPSLRYEFEALSEFVRGAFRSTESKGLASKREKITVTSQYDFAILQTQRNVRVGLLRWRPTRPLSQQTWRGSRSRHMSSVPPKQRLSLPPLLHRLPLKPLLRPLQHARQQQKRGCSAGRRSRVTGGGRSGTSGTTSHSSSL